MNAAMLASGALFATGIAAAAQCQREPSRDRRAWLLLSAASCALLAAYVAMIGRRVT